MTRLTKTTIATLSVMTALTLPLTAQANEDGADRGHGYETLAEMNDRTLDSILMMTDFMKTEQTPLPLFDENAFVPVSQQTIDVQISGPLRFSVMDEFLLQRFENNINERGPIVSRSDSLQFSNTSKYVQSTIASAGISLSF